MQSYAALIQFPELTPLAIAGLLLVLGSIAFGVFGNDYFKRSRQKLTVARVQHQAVLDIYEDKKLTESEIELMEDLIDHYSPENPTRAVTTREGFGQCVQAKMNSLGAQTSGDNFRKMGIRLRDIRNALGLNFIPIGKPIYSSRELHLGQVISIAKQNVPNPNWIRVELKDIDEAFLYVSRQSNSFQLRFEDGDKVECKLWHDEDAKYSFESRIVFHGESNAEWRLSHSAKKMDRTQSREHFRMHFEQTTTVGILQASVNESASKLKSLQPVTSLRGKIVSLSAGGCAVVFHQPIARQVFLRIELEFPDHRPIALEAKIIATSNVSGGRSLIRARFIGTTEAERDFIAKVLRQKQQEVIAPENA